MLHDPINYASASKNTKTAIIFAFSRSKNSIECVEILNSVYLKFSKQRKPRALFLVFAIN